MKADRSSARLTFGKRQRLTSPAEFSRVKAEGTMQRGKLIALGVLAVEGERAARFGFVTPRRAGGAVQRNRIRRRLREIVRLHQGGVIRGFWVVIIARGAAAGASYAQLADEWLRLANRASILRP